MQSGICLRTWPFARSPHAPECPLPGWTGSISHCVARGYGTLIRELKGQQRHCIADAPVGVGGGSTPPPQTQDESRGDHEGTGEAMIYVIS